MIRSTLSGLWRSVRTCALVLSMFAVGFGAVAAPKPTTFRVMSYNIHHGEGLDKKVDLERIAALIKSNKADIVALQEIDKGLERTSKRDFPKELAALTGMTCVFSKNINIQGGEYGNAVLSRYPVRSWTNTHLKMVGNGEQRGILQLKLDVEGRPLIFMATHLDHRKDSAERVQSAGEIRELMNHYKPTPIILCGDFNDTPAGRMHQLLSEMFVDSWKVAGTGEGFTIPAQTPRNRIDYIWISKDAPITPKTAWVPDSQASDHRPVVVEVEWRDA